MATPRISWLQVLLRPAHSAQTINELRGTNANLRESRRELWREATSYRHALGHITTMGTKKPNATVRRILRVAEQGIHLPLFKKD